jgi:hypothetical protein
MKKNMGTLDKGIRLAIAVIIIILNLTNVISGTLSAILVIIAILLVVTSFLSFCPIYTLFGWNSNRPAKKRK